MINLREEFEKLPEVSDALQLIDSFDGYRYYSLNNHRTADWLNGAYYAFQEQQKKIDDARKEINDFFDNQTITPSPREYANKLADILELLK